MKTIKLLLVLIVTSLPLIAPSIAFAKIDNYLWLKLGGNVNSEWCISPNGKYIVFMNEDKLGIWDSETYELLNAKFFEEVYHDSSYYHLSHVDFIKDNNNNPDIYNLVVWYDDKLLFYSVPELELITTKDWLSPGKISKNGNFLAYISDDKHKFLLKDINSHEIIYEDTVFYTIEDLAVIDCDKIGKIELSDDSRYLAVITLGHSRISIYDINNKIRIWDKKISKTDYDVCFSNKSNEFIVAGTDSSYFVDINTKNVKRAFEHPMKDEMLNPINFVSRDDKYFATIFGYNLFLRDFTTGEVIINTRLPIYPAQFSLFEKFAMDFNGYSLIQLDLDSFNIIEKYTSNSTLPSNLFFLGNEYIGSSGLSETNIWNAKNGKFFKRFNYGSGSTGYDDCYSTPDGQCIVTPGLTFYNFKVERDSFKIPSKSCAVTQIEFSKNNKMAVSYYDSTFVVWDLDNKTEIINYKANSEIRRLSFSPDGKYLAVSLFFDSDVETGSSMIWDMNSLKIIKIWKSQYYLYTFSPDSKYLFKYDIFWGYLLRIDLDSNWINKPKTEKLTTFRTSLHDAMIYYPSGKYIISAVRDTISLWDANDGSRARVYTVFPQNSYYNDIIKVDVSPDGSKLAAMTMDGTVYVWDVSDLITDVEDEKPNVVNNVYISTSPNPANETVNIKYKVPSSGFVNITMTNLLGNYQQSILNERKDAGEYQIELNTTGLNSGVYLLRYSNGLSITSTKCIISK